MWPVWGEADSRRSLNVNREETGDSDLKKQETPASLAPRPRTSVPGSSPLCTGLRSRIGIPGANPKKRRGKVPSPLLLQRDQPDAIWAKKIWPKLINLQLSGNSNQVPSGLVQLLS
ncbi:RAN binding protein 3 [Podarcis lilfordi]|uniref:RAN binding protein 3 n=1 Tax=Podarcis lilfordi TaxID=74358 RepID=A0AA35JPC7_9SAUR|nr:RAN binding protein 3 [Podarcis lilfordi]